MKDLYVIDALSYVFRSYFAIRGMTNREGESTGALYGFIRSIEKLIKDFSPNHIVAVFDGPNNKRSRTEIYEEYKSNRAGMPEDLYPQLIHAIHYCELAGIPFLQVPFVEADDVMGSIATWAGAQNTHVYLCSSDKDLCQLVTDNVHILNTHKNNLLIDKEKVKELYGVWPEQIIDYLAIMGDSSDNIPGIPGFGPKTAVNLLSEYRTLNTLLEKASEIANEKRRQKILENRDLAIVSQKLATIQLDVPFPHESDFFLRQPSNVSALTKLYHQMNFTSLLRELEVTVPEEKVEYTLIDTEDALMKLIHELSKEKEICFDTETDQLDPMKANLVGIGFCTKPTKAYYVPFNGPLKQELILDQLQPLFENPHIGFYAHNCKYDLHLLSRYDIQVQNISFDTILASYLLAPQKTRHNLDTITLEKFGKQKISIKSLIGTGKKEISMADVPMQQVSEYCCEDVDYTCRLKNLFQEQLKEHDLEKLLFEIELPLLSVLLKMEQKGVYINTKHLEKMSVELSEKIAELTEKIYAISGEPFNLNSPKQLSQILYEKLQIPPPSKKKATSTAADVLEALKHEFPIAGLVLEYRALEKLRSTYVDTLPLQVHKETKRIHPNFNQSVAATGRLSCQDPNLQNIPVRSAIGKSIRQAFIPEKPNWSYLSADYSQIELRLLAHLSEDPKLIEAFLSGEDIHKYTASLVFEVPLDQVSSDMRSRAKAVNFGIIYGQQAFGLSQQLGISMKDAAAFIETYFQRYPKVKEFLESCKESARNSGMAVTLTGRQRPIPEILSTNSMIRSAAERLAVNTPFQGSQADIIKIAMIRIQKELTANPSLGFMILQIHDELIFECPDSEIPHLQVLVKNLMEGVMTLKVPLTVDISIGKNWGEC